MPELFWVVVVVAAIAILLLIALTGVMKRRTRPFQTRMFPAKYVEPYENRIEELERLFVSQPREAVAGARLLVDDMLTRMGYPVRISNEERVRDLRHFNRTHADRYRLATGLKSNPATEDLLRSLQAYLDTAREMCSDARNSYTTATKTETSRPEIAS
ncbi:MAG: hypothetical protein ABI838_07805 [Chloroflexota bacterium]